MEKSRLCRYVNIDLQSFLKFKSKFDLRGNRYQKMIPIYQLHITVYTSLMFTNDIIWKC